MKTTCFGKSFKRKGNLISGVENIIVNAEAGNLDSQVSEVHTGTAMSDAHLKTSWSEESGIDVDHFGDADGSEEEDALKMEVETSLGRAEISHTANSCIFGIDLEGSKIVTGICSCVVKQGLAPLYIDTKDGINDANNVHIDTNTNVRLENVSIDTNMIRPQHTANVSTDSNTSQGNEHIDIDANALSDNTHVTTNTSQTSPFMNINTDDVTQNIENRNIDTEIEALAQKDTACMNTGAFTLQENKYIDTCADRPHVILYIDKNTNTPHINVNVATRTNLEFENVAINAQKEIGNNHTNCKKQEENALINTNTYHNMPLDKKRIDTSAKTQWFYANKNPNSKSLQENVYIDRITAQGNIYIDVDAHTPQTNVYIDSDANTQVDNEHIDMLTDKSQDNVNINAVIDAHTQQDNVYIDTDTSAEEEHAYIDAYKNTPKDNVQIDDIRNTNINIDAHTPKKNVYIDSNTNGDLLTDISEENVKIGINANIILQCNENIDTRANIPQDNLHVDNITSTPQEKTHDIYLLTNAQQENVHISVNTNTSHGNVQINADTSKAQGIVNINIAPGNVDADTNANIPTDNEHIDEFPNTYQDNVSVDSDTQTLSKNVPIGTNNSRPQENVCFDMLPNINQDNVIDSSEANISQSTVNNDVEVNTLLSNVHIDTETNTPQDKLLISIEDAQKGGVYIDTKSKTREDKDMMETRPREDEKVISLDTQRHAESIENHILTDTDTQTRQGYGNTDIDIQTRQDYANTDTDTQTRQHYANTDTDTKTPQDNAKIYSDTKTQRDNVHTDTDTSTQQEHVYADVDIDEHTPHDKLSTDTVTNTSKDNISDTSLHNVNIATDAKTPQDHVRTDTNTATSQDDVHTYTDTNAAHGSVNLGAKKKKNKKGVKRSRDQNGLRSRQQPDPRSRERVSDRNIEKDVWNCCFKPWRGRKNHHAKSLDWNYARWGLLTTDGERNKYGKKISRYSPKLDNPDRKRTKRKDTFKTRLTRDELLRHDTEIKSSRPKTPKSDRSIRTSHDGHKRHLEKHNRPRHVKEKHSEMSMWDPHNSQSSSSSLSSSSFTLSETSIKMKSKGNSHKTDGQNKHRCCSSKRSKEKTNDTYKQRVNVSQSSSSTSKYSSGNLKASYDKQGQKKVKLCSDRARATSDEEIMETEEERKRGAEDDVDVVTCSDDEWIDKCVEKPQKFSNPKKRVRSKGCSSNSIKERHRPNNKSRKELNKIKRRKEMKPEAVIRTADLKLTTAQTAAGYSLAQTENDNSIGTGNIAQQMNVGLLQSLLNLLGPNNCGQLILDQLFRASQCLPTFNKNINSGVQQEVRENNSMNTIGIDTQHKAIPIDGASQCFLLSHKDMNGGTLEKAIGTSSTNKVESDMQPGTIPADMTTHSDTVNINCPVDPDVPLTIIPTERSQSVGVACKIPKDVNVFRHPESIDLPTAPYPQSTYHSLSCHIYEMGSLDDPRIRKCKLLTSMRERTLCIGSSGRESQTDIVSSIIKSSQVPLADILKRKDVYYTDKPKKLTGIIRDKPRTGKGFPVPVKPSVRKIESDKFGNENVSINALHKANVDKNTIVSILEEFGRVEPPLSPNFSDDIDNDNNTCDKANECDDDSFQMKSEKRCSDIDLDMTFVDFSNRSETVAKIELDQLDLNIDDVGEMEINKQCLGFHTGGARVGSSETFGTSDEIEFNPLVLDFDFDQEVATTEKCQGNDVNQDVGNLLSFCNINNNNPYGNEDSDMPSTRDGSESASTEDEDAPMQDEMSSPILLNACDRVYHIKRDQHIEATSSVTQNAQAGSSWNSLESEEESAGNGLFCPYIGRSTRNDSRLNPNTDILGVAMYNAGINDHAIDTLLNSNTAVEKCFCEDQLYFDFDVCTELTERRNTAEPTPTTTAAFSDSCLPSTSSFMHRQLTSDLSLSDLHDNEIATLLSENSRLLEAYYDRVGPSSHLCFLDQNQQQLSQASLSTPNIRAGCDDLHGGLIDYGLKVSNIGSEINTRMPTQFDPISLDWASMDFIDSSVDETGVTNWLDKTDTSSSLKEGTKKDKERTRQRVDESKMPQDKDFDFNIGGVIVPGSSIERRSRRVRTLEEVNKFDKKYAVPKFVLEKSSLSTLEGPTTSTGSNTSTESVKGSTSSNGSIPSSQSTIRDCRVVVKKRKAPALSLMKKKKERKSKSFSTQDFFLDVVSTSPQISGELNTGMSPKPGSTTRVLRSSNSSEKRIGRKCAEHDDDMTNCPDPSTTYNKKRGRPRRSCRDIASDTLGNMSDNAKCDLGGFTPTHQSNVVYGGSAKPHKYQLIPRTKQHRFYYVLQSPVPTGNSKEHDGDEEGICINNNADTDKSSDDQPETSTQVRDDMDLKAMKRNLRQKDRDLDRYYSRCQRRPERSSFVNSMLHTSSMKRSFQRKQELDISIVDDKKPKTQTAPLDNELKLDLPGHDEPKRDDDELSPPTPDLQPCVVKFVQRMMSCYGDYFCDTTDSTSRDRRLRICDTYLRRHGITPDTLPRLTRRESLTDDATGGNKPDRSNTTAPIPSKGEETFRIKAERPGKSPPEISEFRREKGYAGNDLDSLPSTSGNEYSTPRGPDIEGGFNETFTGGFARGYSPLPKIKEWRHSGSSSQEHRQQTMKSSSEVRETDTISEDDEGVNASDSETMRFPNGRALEDTGHFSDGERHQGNIDDRVDAVHGPTVDVTGSHRDVLLCEESLPLSTNNSERVQYEKAMFSRDFESRLEERNGNRNEMNSDKLLSSVACDKEVAEMLDGVRERVESAEQLGEENGENNKYDKSGRLGRIDFGDGDASSRSNGYDYAANVDDMADKDFEKGNFFENTANQLENGVNETYETKITSSGFKHVEATDETAPLDSLENIANEAEKDFNSTIAGSLLNLETASGCEGEDIDVKEFRANTYGSTLPFARNSKRFSMFQRLVGQNQLSTIQEERDVSDDENKTLTTSDNVNDNDNDDDVSAELDDSDLSVSVSKSNDKDD